MPKKPLAPGLVSIHAPKTGRDNNQGVPRGTPASNAAATAGAGFAGNSTSRDLASWAGTLNGAPAHGPLALGSPGRDQIRQALDMRNAREDDEGTPHSSPLALGSPGRDRIRQALDMRNAREDDNGTPSQRATFNLQRRQTRDAGKGAAPTLSPSQSADFKVANQHYHDSHMQGPPQDQAQGTGAPHKFSPQARIQSYRARVPGGTNAPYGGDPTQAPDYVEPKGKSGK